MWVDPAAAAALAETARMATGTPALNTDDPGWPTITCGAPGAARRGLPNRRLEFDERCR